MPIYEYECAKCHKTTEAIQKFSDLPLTTCPECGGSLTRLVSRTSFQLKGTGWYATDYKKSSGSDAKQSGTTGGAADSGSKKGSTSGGSGDK